MKAIKEVNSIHDDKLKTRSNIQVSTFQIILLQLLYTYYSNFQQSSNQKCSRCLRHILNITLNSPFDFDALSSCAQLCSLCLKGLIAACKCLGFLSLTTAIEYVSSWDTMFNPSPHCALLRAASEMRPQHIIQARD